MAGRSHRQRPLRRKPLWLRVPPHYHLEQVFQRARFTIPVVAALFFVLGGVGGAGAIETIHRTGVLTYERSVYVLDTEPDSALASLAQQRLKALVGVACATLARQAASGGPLAEDAGTFLRILKQELPR